MGQSLGGSKSARRLMAKDKEIRAARAVTVLRPGVIVPTLLEHARNESTEFR
jgi:hypothetical protein